MSTNKKHKEMVSPQKEDKVFWIIMIFFIAVSVIAQIPSVQENNIIFGIFILLRNLIFTFTVIGYSFFCNKPNRVKGFGIFVSAASILFFWIRDFVAKKTEINILTIIIIISLIYSFFLFIKYSIKSKVMIGISVYYSLIYLLIARSMTFVNDDNKALYVVIGIISILFTAISIYLVKKNDNFKYMELSEKIALPFLVFILSAVFLFSGYTNLNCSLEKNAPVTKTYTIVDKKYIHSRGADEYNFCFNIDNSEICVEVLSSDYNSYEIGDKYSIKYSNGFFNDPYYYAFE
ncbi:MAG: hypothetical protein NC397_01675 [Clostridium sp.]|nr:hypothetical protein [Clostridium sp.]